MSVFKVAKCPTDELSLSNCAIVNDADFPGAKHIKVHTGGGQNFIFSIRSHPSVQSHQIGFSLPQRKWAVLSLNQEITAESYQPTELISSIVLEADYMLKKTTSQEQYDSDEMAKEFTSMFPNQMFTIGQQLGFAFKDKKLLLLIIKDIEVVDVASVKSGGDVKPRKAKLGQLIPNTIVQFEKAENSALNLVGKSKGKIVRQSIINPDWDFQKMGIGGLTDEFNAIFRRAFASRVFPPEIVEQLGCKHVKGILLYGPPGTGKTLMARQIGKMLNAREPKIVNGPQILDKYVGESEANVRRLFAEAEEEEKRAGPNSGLHIIIFDEIDAICKQRGSVAGNTGVHDTVVNQLLSKIDGVEQLNNILVIGMTNRRDMIDEALMRPGRLEVQVEISLPNEEGRLQILDIHTYRMKQYKKISPDVDLKELASLTKNFSGAEIEGLIRAAQSTAMNRLIKAASKVEVDPEAIEKLLVSRTDFLHALENDIKPAFGTAQEIINQFLSRGIINWGSPVTGIMEDGMLFIQQARATDTSGLVSVLIEGPPNSGKTALAAQLARNSDFPFVKVCSPEEMVGYTETAKCLTIRKVFDDAYRSTLSCILVDNIERLLDYGPIGPRYSNLTLQALLVLLKKQPPPGKKLLVLCTSSRRQVLEEMEMLSAFTAVLHVPNLSKAEHLLNVLESCEVFSDQDLKQIKHQIHGKSMTTSMKNRERILEAIDQLRRRKARPDIQRISNYLFRRFAINSVEARSDLDWCVANNHVLKVEYKGSISYRNAAKKYAQMKRAKQTTASRQIQQIQGGAGNDKIIKQFSELLTNAFGELIVDEPDYLELGVPGPEIISNILSKDSVRYTKKYISILLEKEVQSGGLIRTDSGNYLMGPAADGDDVIKKEKGRADDWKSAKAEMEAKRGNRAKRDGDSKSQESANDYFDRGNSSTVEAKKVESFENMDSSTNSADEKKSDGALRIGGRRKRAKKVFDPSDNHIPKKRGRPLGSLNRSTIEKQTVAAKSNEDSRPDSRTSSCGREQGGVCSVCHLQNKRGPNDRMVACRECSNKAHFSCLNGDDMMLKMYPDNTWQCPHCKTCIVCFETSDAGNLTVCSVCADAYHARCHQPKILEKYRTGQKWLCMNCQMPEQLKINEIESNIGNSFTQKFKFMENSDASRSNSRSSSPPYSSPPSSTSSPPPRLSPQTTTPASGGGKTGGKPGRDAADSSDSRSDDEEEEEEEEEGEAAPTVDDGMGIDPSIPDATHWTADEVYQYFAQYFPEEAKIFKEQEIDGRSLLLLKRLDVLTNLNLKLGPALKIYKHVVKLQVRRDDPRLYWL